jgi:hypothetical protein
VPCLGNSPKDALATILELESGTRNEIFHSLGDEYLRGACQRSDARTDGAREPADPAVNRFHLAGVQAGADLGPVVSF